MSVHALREPVLTRWVSVARDAVLAAGRVPVASVDDTELSQGLREVVAAESQLRALRLRLLHEADSREMATQSGATGTDAWAAKLTGTTRGVMSGGIWLARLLEEKYPTTLGAFADGGINEQQTRVIVNAAEEIPAFISDEHREAAEAELVQLAVEGMNARSLRQRARRMLDVISRELADEHEATMLDDEQRRAEMETWLSLQDNDNGTFSGKFVIPELHSHLLRNFLERLTSPRRLSPNQAGELVHDDSIPVPGPGLNWSETLGAGFLELLEHLPTDGFGPVGATLLVKLDYEHLLDGLGSARRPRCSLRSRCGEARRLACGSGIVPAVLGGRSEVLDLGRLSRVFNESIKRALSLRHDSCAAEGCERPFAWCELHHPHAWSKGGVTSLDNALPLCGHHHRRAHDRAYDLSVLASGEVRFRHRR